MVEQLGAEQVVDLGRPLVVPGHDVAEAEPLTSLEVLERVKPSQPGGNVAGLGR
jgi:hypothetical protein